MNTEQAAGNLDIAVVGIAGRFPGASNIQEFWENLAHGVESITFYSEKEVIDSGVDPEMARDPDFVPAAGGLEGEYLFDAEFFDVNPREAEIMDPQHRILLECAWEALESAGYQPDACPGRVAVYAGGSINTYLLFNIVPNKRLLDSVGHFQVMTAGDKDFLATRVAYKFNLKGPAMSVQTACSTSLVAINLACQSLLN
jgi:phthiocerol/phenolphthiocerol synthesis type-I polyketide synthase E